MFTPRPRCGDHRNGSPRPLTLPGSRRAHCGAPAAAAPRRRPVATLALISAAVLAVAAPARAATAQIDATATRQTIRGFGGATVFVPTTPLSSVALDKLFGTGPGDIGLTLLRIRLASDDAWRQIELANALGAEARGARVMATPWSPPAAMKSNDSLIGGMLNPSSYADYATYLNNFATFMARNGAPLYAISVQNEPDYPVTYESCNWTADQMLTFCRDNAGAITATRVIVPESFQFQHAMSDPVLNDPTAASHVDIIGGHIYGAGLAPYPLAVSQGKDVWMTEHLDLSTDWAGALATAKEIHDCLATANFNAYFWWYLRRYYGPLGEDDNVTKRGWVMAQFAKFIRPGFDRVDATENPATGVSVSAYVHDQFVVIVAINQNATDVTQTFALANATAPSFTPWVTSATASLAAQAPVAVTNGTFSATLPAESVTTFVSNLVYPAPTIVTPPQGHRVLAGSTVVLDVTADAEFPAFQWSFNGTAIPGATDRMLTLRNFGAANTGTYTVTITNSGGSVTSPGATVTLASAGATSRLVNLSTRSEVGTGDSVQIAGFVVGGTTPQPVLVRAAGPALQTSFGLGGALADPVIELHDSTGAVIATNDNWDAALAPTFAALGAFPWLSGSKDAALEATLAPGAYTAVVSGRNGGTGIALVEVYEAGSDATSGLINVSTRSEVGTGDSVQIGGFVIAGSAAKTVVLRASGPMLGRSFGVSGALADPVIELHRQSDDAIVATSDDWSADLASHFAKVGAFAWMPDSKDAALAATLDPGGYTVVVRGKSDTSGVALVEIYAEP